MNFLIKFHLLKNRKDINPDIEQKYKINQMLGKEIIPITELKITTANHGLNPSNDDW